MVNLGLILYHNKIHDLNHPYGMKLICVFKIYRGSQPSRRTDFILFYFFPSKQEDNIRRQRKTKSRPFTNRTTGAGTRANGTRTKKSTKKTISKNLRLHLKTWILFVYFLQILTVTCIDDVLITDLRHISEGQIIEGIFH